MPSSKGKPTDPKLREKVKEDVKNETNKDGGGKGQWSAWKAAKLSKEYEARGGSYENSPASKNEPKKGTPTPKSTGKRKKEAQSAGVDSPTPARKDGENDADSNDSEDKENAKPKANTSAKKSKASDGQEGSSKGKGRPKKGVADGAKKGKPRTEGTRKSARVAEKRKSENGEEGGSAKKVKK